MFYSEELIEEVRSANDIVDVISTYVKLKRAGNSYMGLCPFHNEKSPSFSVSRQKQMFHCFGCGEGGNVITFIMKYNNYSFSEALEFLADRANIALPKANYSDELNKDFILKDSLIKINNESGKLFHYILKSEKGIEGLKYLKGRGLSDEIIIKFGLGYTGAYGKTLYPYLNNKGFTDDQLKESGLFNFDEKGVRDKFWNRVMFPIIDVNNRIVGFGGRVMSDAKPKYLNSPETKLFDKSRTLYALNFAKLSRKDYFILCEGYMDVIALFQGGFSNAIAALGTAFTSQHTSLIKRYVNNVYLSFDSDGAGIKAALRAISILREAGINVKCIDMNPYKDPDEFIKALGSEEYQKRIDTATNGFIYEIRQMEKEYDRKDPDSKAEFYNKIVLRLLEIEDEITRNSYMEAISNEFVIPIDILKNAIKKKALYFEKDSSSNKYTEDIIKNRVKKNKILKPDKVIQSQRILLTWLIEEPSLYSKIKDYISEEEFILPLYNKVATLLFKQLENGDLNAARIISNFSMEEEQKEVANLFNTNMGENLDLSQKEVILNDTVKNVKNNYIDYRINNLNDITKLQSLIIEKTKLQRMHISLK